MPVCSEVGSPNSAAGKQRSYVSTSSSRQMCSQLFTPNNSALGVQSVGTWLITQSTGIYANLRHATFCEKAKLPSGLPCTANCFVTIGLFLCARHRKLVLTVCSRMFYSSKTIFHISNMPHSQVKSTLITCTLLFYVNVERE